MKKESTATALLVIDVQNGQRPIWNEIPVLENINRLIEFATNKKIPTIFIQHEGKAGSSFDPNTPGFEFMKELHLPSHPTIIKKTHIDSFYKTALQDLLLSQKINNLIICGFQTDWCVDTACRVGHHLGYKITLVKDAHSTQDENDLLAPRIIQHVQGILKNWFVELKETKEIV